MHRDLKPGNVLLTADGPRVIDFGIALLAENPGGLTEAGSTLGSPAYMSPEQALAERVSYASDMFSLGSLLVMAATGSSPFGAGSLAYTLFNIAHTAPNLELLPPELQGLLEPCLHKDPQARPSPAQFLEQVGWPPEQSTGWPHPIHAAIDRQARELASLTSNPDATLVVSRSGSVTNPAEYEPDRGRSAGTSTRKRAAVRGVFAAAVVALLIVAGLAWVRVGENSTGSEVAVSTLTRLREADTCAWLRQALDGSVPAATGWPTDVADWKLSTNWNWGCKAEAAGQLMFVETGDNLEYFVPTGREIDGRSVFSNAGTANCARAADLSDTGDRWGISVRLSVASCDLVEHVFTRLIAARAAIPTLTDSASLAIVDPCGLVSWDLLNDTIGPLAKKPAKFSAHSCVWQGAKTATIELRRVVDFSVERSIDLSDGTRLDIETQTAGSALCNLYYTYQNVGDQREVVKVVVDSAGSREQRCATGESIMRSLLPNLPKPN